MRNVLDAEAGLTRNLAGKFVDSVMTWNLSMNVKGGKEILAKRRFLLKIEVNLKQKIGELVFSFQSEPL